MDVETCKRCGGIVRIMAGLTQPEEVKRYIQYVGETYLPPSIATPRHQAQALEFDIPFFPEDEPVIRID